MGPLAPNPEFWVVTSWLGENPLVYPDRHLEDRTWLESWKRGWV
jgi:hypothetical protein